MMRAGAPAMMPPIFIGSATKSAPLGQTVEVRDVRTRVCSRR